MTKQNTALQFSLSYFPMLSLCCSMISILLVVLAGALFKKFKNLPDKLVCHAYFLYYHTFSPVKFVKNVAFSILLIHHLSILSRNKKIKCKEMVLIFNRTAQPPVKSKVFVTVSKRYPLK
jgi:hypothetical protein